MRIDLTKCRTKEEIEAALAPLGETMGRLRAGFAKAFGEDEPDEEPPVPVAYCPRCGAPWFTLEAGFCGGCGR